MAKQEEKRGRKARKGKETSGMKVLKSEAACDFPELKTRVIKVHRTSTWNKDGLVQGPSGLLKGLSSSLYKQ